MKQPELGRKISELRKAKGLTQEELVEKCNISVRTIQRIESGEVMPRSYTVKTILAALSYDLHYIPEEEGRVLNKTVQKFRKFLLLDMDTGLSSDYLIKQLNLAWIAGLIYFLVGFAEGTADYFRSEEQRIIVGDVFYLSIKTVMLITYFYFQRGFVLAGGIFHNYLLKIISLILIFGNTMVDLYDMASIFYWPVERTFVLGAEALTFGGIGIIYGVSLIRLKYATGSVAVWAGVFEIIAACFFLTIILGFVGFIILIPAELFEIIILFKAGELIRTKQNEPAYST